MYVLTQLLTKLHCTYVCVLTRNMCSSDAVRTTVCAGFTACCVLCTLCWPSCSPLWSDGCGSKTLVVSTISTDCRGYIRLLFHSLWLALLLSPIMAVWLGEWSVLLVTYIMYIRTYVCIYVVVIPRFRCVLCGCTKC